MNINEILRQAAQIVADELKEGYRLFLFGSRAKGTCDDKSDIDIGILSDAPITGKQLLVIQEELDRIPTLLKIDFVDFNAVDDAFKKIALKHTQDINI